MEQKRSRGVAIFGWIFISQGFIGTVISILNTLLFFLNRSLWIKVLYVFLHKTLVIRNKIPFFPVDISISQLASAAMDTMQMATKNLVYGVITFVAMPVMWVLIFLGGIGILKLQERWREGIIWVYIIFELLGLIQCVYIKVGVGMSIAIGKIAGIKDEANIVYALTKAFGMLQNLLLKNLFNAIILIAIIIFFFTRPRVKEQFR